MKFFYNLKRSEIGEYVVVEVTDDVNVGTGAIVPEKSRGENYKTIMGVIEEFRYTVELSTIEDAFCISEKLERIFPGHPKVVFAIDAAFKELYSKSKNISLKKLIGRDIQQECIENKSAKKVFPEYIGQIDVIKSLPKIFDEDFTFVLTKYPNNEMWEVLKALSTNFEYVEVLTWKERLSI
ncbi:enolase-like domain-containing protein [Thermosipho atlanticus]|uniref:Uncharacterized protein n=1 Tax=Thermosipho atlanticus DSM 15807 TaxID=1123380 RepID=A0A1M5TW50_9BACT|nr:hypothetical protein [Thermosipho atlanticus]SHH55017.1 hypothetical protein SAMN02745199_1514 [Thermosipho atlanticus DSM 15807]